MIDYHLAIKNEGNPVIWHNMDYPGGHYANWNTSGIERQTLYALMHMWNLKMSTQRSRE
jgi:hypothetical protein